MGHDIAHIEHIARCEMRKWGLFDQTPAWCLEWTSAKSICGDCNYVRRRIRLSRILLDHPLNIIINTVRHEIAHALVGHRAGHGPVWKETCLRVGAEPSAVNHAVQRPVVWRLICTVCGTEHAGTIRRRSDSWVARRRCAKCRGVLVQKKVGQPVDSMSGCR